MKEKLKLFQQSFRGEFHFDDLHKKLYATDASVYRKLPLAVAFPKDEHDIKHLISFAKRNNTSLIPRTAGTSLAGQCVGEGIIVDVSKHFTKIVSVNTNDRTVTVQPGVVRDELNAYLKPMGLFFGPNTSTSNRCMIGGMVGNNSSGTTSIQHGVTRDKVLQLKTILSSGDEIVFHSLSRKEFDAKTQLNSHEGSIYRSLFKLLEPPEVRAAIEKHFPKAEIHRRNTGYALDSLIKTTVFSENQKEINVCSLLCGSEGTLAFTTEITLQLDPLPPAHTAMVVAHYHTLEACLSDVPLVMQHELHTCEMMDDVILDCTKDNMKYESYRFFVEGSPKALLLLELKAHTQFELEQQIQDLKSTLTRSAGCYSSPLLMGSQTEMALELRKAGLGLLGNMVGDKKAVACIEDTAVALDDLPNYINEFTALMRRYQQKAVYYAHAGAGELHLRPILNLKNKQDVALFRKITTDVAHLVKKYQGSFSGEHGDGIVRAEFIELLIGSQNFKLLQQIKTIFDPANIFNPGKIVDAFPMDESLRYTPGRQEPMLDTFMNFEDSGGLLRLSEKCNGSGDCRKSAETPGTMCPSYQATKDEKDTTRARANVLREVLTHSEKQSRFDSHELKEVFDLCISCKACGNECPSNVDMSIAKAEFLYQYHQTHGMDRTDVFFGKSTYYNKMASRFPKLTNWVLHHNMTSRIIKKWMGVAANRSFPSYSTKTFNHLIKKYINQESNKNKNRSLFLLLDEFSRFYDTDIAVDAFELLTGLGYQITIVENLDSARALLSKGLLAEAKVEIDKNITVLKDKISNESPLLGIEPSAILGFRDEYLRLASDIASAKEVAINCFLIEEFIASEIKKGVITEDCFTSEEKNIKVHGHCHQKSLSNQKVTFDMLNIPKNYKPTLITSGCCGMAGSFGFESKHYEVSMKIGELRLFPSIRKAPEETLIAANGTSCRHQIKDGTGRKALHPITILRRALLS